jgi:hypothetical protein
VRKDMQHESTGIGDVFGLLTIDGHGGQRHTCMVRGACTVLLRPMEAVHRAFGPHVPFTCIFTLC